MARLDGAGGLADTGESQKSLEVPVDGRATDVASALPVLKFCSCSVINFVAASDDSFPCSRIRCAAIEQASGC